MLRHRQSDISRMNYYGFRCAHAVYEVPSHGRWYYRYVVCKGHEVILSKHIPGGAVGTALADARGYEVGRFITIGRSPDDVLELIKSWGKKK